jgi:hypothetical protein
MRRRVKSHHPLHDSHSGFVQITVSCRIHFVDDSHHDNPNSHELSAFVHNSVFLWKHIAVVTEKSSNTCTIAPGNMFKK